MKKMTSIKPEFEEDDEQKSGKDSNTVLGDGDGDDEEDGFSGGGGSNEPICTWSEDLEEHRRAFVFDRMANADYDGETLVKNMQILCEWLKNGRKRTPAMVKQIHEEDSRGEADGSSSGLPSARKPRLPSGTPD